MYLGFPKNNVSHFDFSSLCVFYRSETLQTGIFLKYIGQAYIVIKFQKQIEIEINKTNKNKIAQTQ